MHVDHVLPLAIGHFVDHRRTDDAGVVDETVQGTETSQCIGDRTIGYRRFSHAALYCQHAFSGQVAGRGGQSFPIQVHGHNIGT